MRALPTTGLRRLIFCVGFIPWMAAAIELDLVRALGIVNRDGYLVLEPEAAKLRPPQ